MGVAVGTAGGGVVAAGRAVAVLGATVAGVVLGAWAGVATEAVTVSEATVGLAVDAAVVGEEDAEVTEVDEAVTTAAVDAVRFAAGRGVESFFEEPPQAAVNSVIAAMSAVAANGRVFMSLTWGRDGRPLSGAHSTRAKVRVHAG